MRRCCPVDAVIPVLYEDNHLLAVVKPAGVPVQEDSSGDADLLTLLKAYIKEKYRKPGAVYLGLIHRLDRPVGGVMVFARTSKAAARLSAAIREGRTEKEYLCVCLGEPAGGVYEDWLLKDGKTFSSRSVPPDTPGGKPARLTLAPLQTREGLTLCRVTLATGRSHQIRVQCASRGTPLWGDQRYNPSVRPGQDIALFCVRMTVPHPVKKEAITFTASPQGKIWDLFDLPPSGSFS
ncbi:MAG: RluA family pseudouridine synthase [Christensenellales bacterium]